MNQEENTAKWIWEPSQWESFRAHVHTVFGAIAGKELGAIDKAWAECYAVNLAEQYMSLKGIVNTSTEIRLALEGLLPLAEAHADQYGAGTDYDNVPEIVAARAALAMASRSNGERSSNEVLIRSYDDLREGDVFLVGSKAWEVVNDGGTLGIWTNACKCYSPSLCEELIQAGVRVLRPGNVEDGQPQ